MTIEDLIDQVHAHGYILSCVSEESDGKWVVFGRHAASGVPLHDQRREQGQGRSLPAALEQLLVCIRYEANGGPPAPPEPVAEDVDLFA